MRRTQMLVAVLAIAMAAPRDSTAEAQALTRAIAIEAVGNIPADTVVAIAETPQAWYARGRAFYESNRYRESIAAFERSLQLRADARPEGAWHIARAYAQLGNRKQALRWLQHARQLGILDQQAVRDEPAFRQYREDPGFRALVSPTSCSSCRVGYGATVIMN